MQWPAVFKVGLALPCLALFFTLTKAAEECPPRTVILPTQTEYNKYCGDDGFSNSTWTCFHHILGSVHNVKVTSIFPSSKERVDGGILARNGDLQEFTTRESEQELVIKYLDEGITLTYSRKPSEKCYILRIDSPEHNPNTLLVQDLLKVEDDPKFIVNSRGTIQGYVCARDLVLLLF